jgi:hypothetical protein
MRTRMANRAGRPGWSAGSAGAVVILVALVIAGFVRVDAATTDLAVPSRSNSTASIAADGDTVAIAWGASTADGATDIYTAVSHDAGRTFGAPVRVNDVPGDARLSGEQPPRLAVRGRSITVVWTTKGARGTLLKQSTSTDAGVSFARAAPVPGSDAAGNRGWQAVAVEAGGRVDVVWLDHRDLASDSAVATTHHDHGGGGGAKPDGVAMAQKSKLFLGATDASLAPRAITGGVCYCCKTALSTNAHGDLFAAWRHVYPGNLRDMAFTVSRDRGKTFAPPLRVSEDKWMLEGCPDDGPTMSVDANDRIHMVWPTLVENGAGVDATIALFYAASADGRAFTPRQRIPTEGMPHHPQMTAASNGTLTLVWDEGGKGGRRIAVARASSDPSGRPTFVRSLVDGGDVGVYPVVAHAGGAAVVAWTSGTGAASKIRVARIQ